MSCIRIVAGKLLGMGMKTDNMRRKTTKSFALFALSYNITLHKANRIKTQAARLI